MPQSTKLTSAKSERFHIRATRGQANLIKAAAARRKSNLTDYIVDSTCVQAEMDLADQNHFTLSPKNWDAFMKALDAPPRVPAGLRRLFARRTTAERR